MSNLSKDLLEEYEEAFHRPEGQVRLLTKSQATFIRAVMKCNEINEISRTIHEQEIKNKQTTIN